jgi:hypothetical protein
MFGALAEPGTNGWAVGLLPRPNEGKLSLLISGGREMGTDDAYETVDIGLDDEGTGRAVDGAFPVLAATAEKLAPAGRAGCFVFFLPNPRALYRL